jgi:hypothetical protein
VGLSIRQGFDFESAKRAYDDHARLLMTFNALHGEGLLRPLALRRKGRRDTRRPSLHLWACFVTMLFYACAT